jgi:nonribosomal peptide synthetase DhbF
MPSRYANTPWRQLGDSDLAAVLHETLRRQLPDYMVPAAISVLPAWPLTRNGKLDLAALPNPMRPAQDHCAPRTPREHLLSQLFASVLSLTRVGIDDDFFALGGHSLSAARLISRAGRALGATLSIRTLFEAPTVRTFCARLCGETRTVEAFDTLLPIRARGTLPPLFCIHPVGGLSWAYAGLLNGIEAERPVYGIQARGIVEAASLPDSIEAMARDYLRVIREVQPEGPFHLLGWSLGGLIAQAMARQLQDQSLEVGLLALMDSYPMGSGDVMPEWDTRQVLAGLALALEIPLGEQSLSIEAFLAAARQAGHVLGCLEAEQGQRFMGLFEDFRRFVPAFRPEVVAGDMLFFEATRAEAVGINWAGTVSPMVWQPYFTGRIHTRRIACAHTEMANPGPIGEIGRLIEQYIREVRCADVN